MQILLFKGAPTNIYWFKVINRNIRKWWEICSNSATKTPKRRPDIRRRRSSVFDVNFEQISNLFSMFSFLTLNR